MASCAAVMVPAAVGGVAAVAASCCCCSNHVVYVEVRHVSNDAWDHDAGVSASLSLSSTFDLAYAMSCLILKARFPVML